MSLAGAERTKKLVDIARSISDALTVSSLAGGLGMIDATTEPFEAKVEGRPEQEGRQFGIQAAYEATNDRIVFEGTTTVVTVEDLAALPSDDREFIADLEDGLRRNYDRWSKIRENLGDAAGARDDEIEKQLARVAKLICRDLNHILDFLRKIHKYKLEDHYGRYRYICSQLEQS